MRFADKRRIIYVADLKLLPSDNAFFELSEAPLSWEERQVSASESSKRILSVAASTNKCADFPITLNIGLLGHAFAS